MLARRLAALALALAALAPRDAGAFCGFYVSGGDQKLTNDATMVVLMREGQRTVLSMQNNYKGPPADFAMVVPVPVVLQKENVKTLPRDVFDRVDLMASPRLVEYWEQDPCPTEGAKKDSAPPPMAAAPLKAAGRVESASDLGVRVEAEFTVGEYEVVVLSARDSDGLDTWLRENHYRIPDGAEPVLRPYVAKGMKFFVAKVNATKVRFEGGSAVLSPLRFHYDSDDFGLPVRLGLLNSGGAQELVVHVLARGKRYEVANYPNVFVPTNLDVSDDTRDRFGAFYAALFDRTMEKHPGAVVTEYAWDAQSCDPCPGPALGPADIITLGADALAPSAPPPNLATDPTLRAEVHVGAVENPEKVPNVEVAIRRFQRRLDQCYTTELARTPSPRGKMRVQMTLGELGRATAVKGTSATAGLPASLVSCVEGTLRGIYFGRGAQTKAQVVVPLELRLEKGEPGQGWYKPPPVNAWGFTLTRLHTRYGKEALGQDLILREAAPVIGGREEHGVPEQDHGAKPGSTNNFQARYAIRHAWTGPIACANPRRGVWGGPPPGESAKSPQGAAKIAYVPRGGVDLSAMVKQGVPDLGLAPASTPAGSGDGAGRAGGKSGCACRAGEGTAPGLGAALAALGAAVLGARRRRRR